MGSCMRVKGGKKKKKGGRKKDTSPEKRGRFVFLREAKDRCGSEKKRRGKPLRTHGQYEEEGEERPMLLSERRKTAT